MNFYCSSGSLHLNRQAIALLESRLIPHSIFLLFQNHHLLWLVESLLYLPSTYELLNERLPQQLIQLRDLILIAQVDLIHEPFFRQLITTVCKHEIKRIQVKRKKFHKKKFDNFFLLFRIKHVFKYRRIQVEICLVLLMKPAFFNTVKYSANIQN